MSDLDPQLVPQPRPLTRRGGWVLGVIGLVIVVLYALVVHFYNAEGGNVTAGGLQTTKTSGIIATIDPVDVNAEKDRATLNISLGAQGPEILDTNGKLKNATRILVSSSLGTQEVKYAAGEPLGRFESLIGVDGEQALYPFDNHVGDFQISAETYKSDGTGGLETLGFTNVGLQQGGGVSGWDTVNDFPTQMLAQSGGEISFTRSFSTKVFAILMLFLVALLSGTTLIVAALVYTNRRKAEVGLMAWAGGVLFALPLLRNYLPYGPPVGAAIDIYIYLWAIVAAVSAVTLFVIGWVRQNRAVLEAAREFHDGA
jgi:hypothetical protein